MADNSSYKNIFKTTFLFGFVQIFDILVKVGTNKIIAILLGAEGLGVISIFNSATGLIKTACGMGINKSAVKDISEAQHCNDVSRVERVISLTNNVIVYTSLLGLIVTFSLAPFLSEWCFGSSDYTLAFIFLSLFVAMGIFSDGQLGILTGIRRLKDLAKASMVGAIAGLLSAIPFYFCLGMKGIVPSLISTAFVTLVISVYFVKRLHYKKIKLKFLETWKEAKPMTQMGVSLMFVSFVSFLFDLLVSAYIRKEGGLDDVGFYQAGATIITSYFGIVLTAMTTDYYPRISAINSNNNLVESELNKQAETGLVLIFPIAVLFGLLSPLIYNFLYSDRFCISVDYTDYAIFGTIIIVVSNCMGMVLLAKQVPKIFVTTVILQRVVLIVVYLVLYKIAGLKGLGLAYLFSGLLHLFIMTAILKWKYDIRLKKKSYIGLLFISLFVLLSIIIRKSDLEFYYVVILGVALFVLSILFTNEYMKRVMGLNIIRVVSNKLRK